MKLKRLWDTDNKRIVWVVGPSGIMCQAWTDESGSYIYVYDNGKWNSTAAGSATGFEYGAVWKQLADEEVGFYDTNEPTNLYSWDSGDKAAYRFMNGTTVLQSGTVNEGATPEYTGDTPTKSATAQYTYTFSGWKPTVGPITKKTDFKAQFDKTVNTYTVTIAVNSDTAGYTEPSTITNVPYGVAVSEDENHVLSVGTTTVTPHANSGYHFVSWSTLPETITGATTITATFEADA